MGSSAAAKASSEESCSSALGKARCVEAQNDVTSAALLGGPLLSMLYKKTRASGEPGGEITDP